MEVLKNCILLRFHKLTSSLTPNTYINLQQLDMYATLTPTPSATPTGATPTPTQTSTPTAIPTGWQARTYEYSETIPHAVETVDDGQATVGSYEYDENGNMICRVEEGITYKQEYNTENRISSIMKLAEGTCEEVVKLATKWDFTYDGDGTRTATLTTTYDENGSPTGSSWTAYYFGGAYEVRSDSTTIKYYSFAGQTIMNDGSGLKYFLTDHLGSVVAITDDEGNLISEQRYLPFGGIRTDIGSIIQTDYGYTGQRNLDSDIGLMDYKARFYSPVLNRFIQPDSIVPSGAQGLNRYSYVGNNPIGNIDPTGHNPECGPDGVFCGGGNWIKPKHLEYIKLGSLTSTIQGVRNVSGEDMYEMYKLARLLKALNTGENLTIKDFTIQLLAYEFQPYPYTSSSEVSNKDAYYFEQLKAAGTLWLWCSPNAETNACTDLNKNGGITNAALLNWLAGMESMRKRYDSVFNGGKDAYEQIFLQPANLSLASEYYKIFVSPPNMQWALNASDPNIYNNRPATWGNISMFEPNSGIESASEGFACNQVVARWGTGDSALVMTPCQVNFFRSR